MHTEYDNSLDFIIKATFFFSVYRVDKNKMIIKGKRSKSIPQYRIIPPFWQSRLILCRESLSTQYKFPILDIWPKIGRIEISPTYSIKNSSIKHAIGFGMSFCCLVASNIYHYVYTVCAELDRLVRCCSIVGICDNGLYIAFLSQIIKQPTGPLGIAFIFFLFSTN